MLKRSSYLKKITQCPQSYWKRCKNTYQKYVETEENSYCMQFIPSLQLLW